VIYTQERTGCYYQAHKVKLNTLAHCVMIREMLEGQRSDRTRIRKRLCANEKSGFEHGAQIVAWAVSGNPCATVYSSQLPSQLDYCYAGANWPKVRPNNSKRSKKNVSSRTVLVMK
jgi:hypothetical protein